MTISRRAPFGKLNLTPFRGIESATAFAKLRGNPYVELTHWIHQLWQLHDSDLHRVCRHYQVDAQAVEKDLASALSGLPSGATSLNDFSDHVEAAVERAWVLSSLEFDDRCVRSAWLLAALMQTPELRRVLLGISPAFRRIPVEQLTDAIAALVAGSPEDREGPHDGSGLPSAMRGEASGVIADSPGGKSALARCCTDLTERARGGQIDPVIGRAEHELSAHEARWQEELAMVQQIHALRTRRREEGESGAEGEWPSARLQALEEELLFRQQDAPLVFSQIDESVVAAVVADWTGIPAGRMLKDEVAAVCRLAGDARRRRGDGVSSVAGARGGEFPVALSQCADQARACGGGELSTCSS